jgi:hypothetical protein
MKRPTTPPQENFLELFGKRANSKRTTSYWMLGVSILIILTGFFLFFWHLHDMARQTSDKEKLSDLNLILNTISQISFMVFIFFAAQIFLKLYRYNMNLSNFYTSCRDSIKINEEIENIDKKKVLVELLKVFYPKDIKVEIPATDLSPLNTSLKKGD